MPSGDALFHWVTMIGTLGGLYVAYRGVSIQMKQWQEKSSRERDLQHQENTRKMDRIENTLLIQLTPVWEWFLHRHDDEHDT